MRGVDAPPRQLSRKQVKPCLRGCTPLLALRPSALVTWQGQAFQAETLAQLPPQVSRRTPESSMGGCQCVVAQGAATSTRAQMNPRQVVVQGAVVEPRPITVVERPCLREDQCSVHRRVARV